jgi:hypothetical protein
LNSANGFTPVLYEYDGVYEVVGVYVEYDGVVVVVLG